MKPFPPGSQQARLLVMLRAGPVSHLQAMVEGIGRCSDVVLKLRRRGYVISMQMDSMVNTRGLMVHFGRYWLLREPGEILRQHDWGVCGCEPIFDGFTNRQTGWLYNVRIIQKAELLPQHCRICSISLKASPPPPVNEPEVSPAADLPAVVGGGLFPEKAEEACPLCDGTLHPTSLICRNCGMTPGGGTLTRQDYPSLFKALDSTGVSMTSITLPDMRGRYHKKTK